MPERGAQHALVVAHPGDDAADDDVAELVEIRLGRRPPDFAEPLLAVARGKRHQCVEIGFLALEPAVEGADGGVDFGAERLDRQLGKASRPQHVGAGAQQRQRRLAAALLA